MDLSKLKEPFPVGKIHWRIGSITKDKKKAMALAYLDARDVMDRLDEVCGMGGWGSKTGWSDGKKLECSIGIKITPTVFDCQTNKIEFPGEWVWKSNGAGDTSVEADKGAFSDAFKRAGVMWGIGRYLYQTPNWWVAINDFKQFNDTSIEELNGNYSQFIAPDNKELFDRAMERNRESVESMIYSIGKGLLSEAAEAWGEIQEEEQRALWLAKSKGGIFDQKHKEIIKSTEFRV